MSKIYSYNLDELIEDFKEYVIEEDIENITEETIQEYITVKHFDFLEYIEAEAIESFENTITKKLKGAFIQ